MPVGLGVVDISNHLPKRAIFFDAVYVFVRDTPIEALDESTPSSDSANIEQLPCFGV